MEIKKPVSQHYVKNKDLLPELAKFKETGRLSENLGQMILLIARNLSNRGNYVNYTWREDMVGEAVLTCVKYVKYFDPEKSSNAFAYITTICNHAFINFIKKSKKHSEIKDKLFQNQHLVNDDVDRAIDYTILNIETIGVLEVSTPEE